MYKLDNRLVQEDGKSLGYVLISIFSTFLITFICGNFFVLLFFSYEEISNITEHPELRTLSTFVQGFSNFLIFGGSSLIILYLFLKKDLSWLNRKNQKLKWVDILIPFVIFFASYALIEYTIEWNKNINFPSGIAEWAKALEKSAEKQAKFMLDFDSIGELLFTLLIIGGLVAVAEELFFRGIIQNFLFAWIKNIHVAIFLTGIIFSAVHFQFYGFLPRLVLSILISYIYFISGKIWLPMLLHFINNGTTVIANYFIEDAENTVITSTSAQAAFTSLLFIILVLVFYYRQHKEFYTFTGKHE